MREDLRHSVESKATLQDKVEFGDGQTERNARRALGRKGIKQKFLGKKNPFKNK